MEKISTVPFLPTKIIHTSHTIHLLSVYGELVSYNISSSNEKSSLISNLASNLSSLLRKNDPLATPPFLTNADWPEKSLSLSSVKERCLVFKHPRTKEFFFSKGFCSLLPTSSPQEFSLACAGYWDNSFRILAMNLSKQKSVQIFAHKHKDIITCIAFHKKCSLLLTASRDGSILVWKVRSSSGQSSLENEDKPVAFLYGNNGAIRCLEVNEHLNVAVACDGKTLTLYDLPKCRYLRSIAMQRSAHLIKLSNSGVIVTFSLDNKTIQTFSINGNPLQRKNVMKIVVDMHISSDSEYLFLAIDSTLIVLRLFDLKEMRSISVLDYNLDINQSHAFISAISFNDDKKLALLTLQDCSLICVCFN